MNLRLRYRSRGKKRIIRFLVFYSFLVVLLILHSTFAKYTTVVDGTPKTQVADWHVKINEIDITQENTFSNLIELIPEGNVQTTYKKKLAPGQTGYFEIIINPEGTDVATQYNIDFDTSNLPKGIILTNYEIIEDNISSNFINGTSIEGEINLNNTNQSLSESDKKTVRIYWKWEETSTTIPTKDIKYYINSTITVKQKIEN